MHIGPIQVNRGGDYQYYLWLGVWNNMEATTRDDYRDGLDSIIIFADGEPLSLQIAGWVPESIGASESVYLKPVASSSDSYYRVTADQIRLIADAADFRIRTTGARPREYGPWYGQGTQSKLRQFLQATSF